MRIRSIKPEFWESENLGRISREARLLFIGLFSCCDDSGRTRAASRLLASRLFPYDEDAIALLPGWLDELAQNKCIRLYEVEGETYLDIPKWLAHQKIDKPTPSKLPAFREGSRGFEKNSSGLGMGTGNGNREQGMGTGNTPLPPEGGEAEGDEDSNKPPLTPEPDRSASPGAASEADSPASGTSPRARKPKPGYVLPSELPAAFGQRLVAIGELMRRQPTTPWAPSEVEAVRAARLDALDEEAFEAQLTPLRRYYHASIPKESDYRRRDLGTLLNHWAGELDRARAWTRDNDDGVTRY